jgi:pSer/pThr/pTyr-binding forkhead associated (FHA) protein
MNTLDNLEARLKSMIENHLVKLIPGHKPEDLISQKLASVMYTQIRSQGEDSDLAPNVYVIIAHPSFVNKWRQESGFLDGLAQALEIAGTEANLKFASRVTISVSPDATLSKNEVQIIGSFSLGGMSETQGMQMDSEDQKLIIDNPKNSFLILNGSEVIALDQPVINIGRRLDNHIVIDDPRISRNHAQIRAIKDHFAIFDLNSTGGTFVNGDQINQSILYPGDVLSLAGVTLIFGEDQTSSELKDLSTRPNASISSENQSTEEKPVQ